MDTSKDLWLKQYFSVITVSIVNNIHKPVYIELLNCLLALSLLNTRHIGSEISEN